MPAWSYFFSTLSAYYAEATIQIHIDRQITQIHKIHASTWIQVKAQVQALVHR